MFRRDVQKDVYKLLESIHRIVRTSSLELPLYCCEASLLKQVTSLIVLDWRERADPIRIGELSGELGGVVAGKAGGKAYRLPGRLAAAQKKIYRTFSNETKFPGFVRFGG